MRQSQREYRRFQDEDMMYEPMPPRFDSEGPRAMMNDGGEWNPRMRGEPSWDSFQRSMNDWKGPRSESWRSEPWRGESWQWRSEPWRNESWQWRSEPWRSEPWQWRSEPWRSESWQSGSGAQRFGFWSRNVRSSHDDGFMERMREFFGSRDESAPRARGPKGWKRTDERLYESVCEALERHPEIDVSDITVRVQNCECTLEGTVPSRRDKHFAEYICEEVWGIEDVHNHLRVKPLHEIDPRRGDKSMRRDSGSIA